MNAREKALQEEFESSKEYSRGRETIDLASVLEDFLDEEVVDKNGQVVGTLACYWQSVSGRLVFLGVKLKNRDSIHVILGRRSQLDERRSCIRIGFDAALIETAPCFDCSREMDAALERAVYEHFRAGQTRPQGPLKHVAPGSSKKRGSPKNSGSPLPSSQSPSQ
jgi:hypothetical protein